MKRSEEIKAQIRDMAPGDYSHVLGLNQAAMPLVNELREEKLTWLAAVGAHMRVAEERGQVCGFLIAVADECGYQSPYIQWFYERYSRFLYVDRIVVVEWARGRRVGWRLFEDLERTGHDHSLSLASEVYSKPANIPSLRFHRRFGFRWVGTQVVEDGKMEVAKFTK